jgi:NADH dehydrogenase
MILVTGGTGAMGSVLVRELAGRNHRTRVVCMPGDPFVSRVRDCCEDIRFADVSDPRACEGICDGIETVYHLAAIIISKEESAFARINVEGTRNIVGQAVRSKVGHFVYVSSASVLYPRPTPYSLSKRNAEEIVISSGLPYSIIRPTLVYGEKGGQEFDMYLEYLKKFPMVPFIGSGAPLKRPVFVEDITQGLLALCDNKEAKGKIYNFSGGEAMSILDFSRLCLKCMGMGKKRIARLPVWLCKVIARMMALVMRDPPLKWQVIAGITQDANLDPSEAMTDLGYAPKKVSEWLPRVFPRKQG